MCAAHTGVGPRPDPIDGRQRSTTGVPPAGAARLLGRGTQLAAVDAHMTAITRTGGALLLRGEAGIGKSALLEVAAQRARDRGWTVLSVTAGQSETLLPFAGLHQLLLPVSDRIEALPGPQQAAVRAAFGMVDHVAPDIFQVGLATLHLLGEAATGQPLLAVVDDAQWLDRASCDVLLFVARRVAADHVGLLGAARDGTDSALTLAGLPELRIPRLDDDDAAVLLDDRAPGLAPGVRSRLLQEAAGNPLALTELPVGLSVTRQDDLATLPTWLPLTHVLEQAFALRLSDMPDATRRLLLLAAVDDGGALGDVLTAAEVGDADVGVDDLTPAAAAGLVDVDKSAIRFRHPLIRSAVYQAASIGERYAAHAALAQTLADQPDRRAWHRAEATVGPDEDVACELTELAARATRRGAPDAAIMALQRAAALGASGPARLRRLLRAATLAVDIGQRDVAQHILDDVQQAVTDPIDAARLLWLRETLASDPVINERRRVLVRSADVAREGGATDLAVDLLWLAAMRCWWNAVDDGDCSEVADAIARCGPGMAGPRLTLARAYATPPAQATARIDEVVAAAGEARDAEAMWLLGNAVHILGAFDIATTLLSRASDALRRDGRLGPLARVLSLQAWADVHLGQWDRARPAADEAGRLAEETDQPVWRAGAIICRALLAAGRGEDGEANALLEEAQATATAIGARFILATLQHARGFVALARGDHAMAFEELRLLFDRSERAYHPPTTCGAVGDLAEAAAYCGALDDARSLVADVPLLHAPGASGWIRASLLVARPLLATATGAGAAFEASLACDLSRWPVHRARLQLAHGVWLRRQRRVAASRAPLRAARDTFDALGAAWWSAQARRELRAAGESSRPRRDHDRDRLTPQELQIAELAADGLSNREIGRQLFLSHRTVGSHLYRIFPKLGITSRAQLTNALER